MLFRKNLGQKRLHGNSEAGSIDENRSQREIDSDSGYSEDNQGNIDSRTTCIVTKQVHDVQGKKLYCLC